MIIFFIQSKLLIHGSVICVFSIRRLKNCDLVVFAAENFFIRGSKTNYTFCIFRIICIYLSVTYKNKPVGIKVFINNDLTVGNDEESVRIQTLTENIAQVVNKIGRDGFE